MLLSALVKRVGVSCIQDFFFIFQGREERLGRLVQGEREVVIRMGKVGERKVYGRGNMEEGRRMKGGRG